MAELCLLHPFEFGEYKRKGELHLKLSLILTTFQGRARTVLYEEGTGMVSRITNARKSVSSGCPNTEKRVEKNEVQPSFFN